MKTFGEFKANITEDGHMDLASAKRSLSIIMDESEEMLEELSGMDPEDHMLPSWWMNKINRAKESVSAARDYLLYPQDDEPEEEMPMMAGMKLKK
jgi:hypothetical protein